MGFNFTTFKKTFLLFIPHYIFRSASARIRWFFAAAFILVDVGAATLVPYSTKIIVESLSITINHSVWIALGFLGFFWILEKTVSHIQEIIFFPAINQTIRNLSYNLVNHLHQISLPDYKKLSIPEVINCIRRISLCARSFIKVVFLLIIPTFLKLSIAVYLTAKVGVFGWIFLAAILCALFLLYKGAAWYTTARETAWHITDQVTMRVNDSLLNTKLIRPFKSFEMHQIGDILDVEAKLWQETNTRLHSIYIVMGIWLGLTITSILAGAILGIQKGVLTVGDFVLIKGQLIAAFLPLRTFALEFRQLAESLVDIKKIVTLFEIPTESSSKNISVIPNDNKNGIFLNNISYTYDNHHFIFHHLSLQIPLGKKVAIIGETGCGKSTLINLIASFYKPSQGNISIHGLPNPIIHCIPQEFRLFNLSLRDNITYGLSNISEGAMLKAAEQVGLARLIQTLPNGLNSLVGEMGTKLSGGEKQKIALARALLLKPDILLLDETTSALNFESEKQVLNALSSIIPTIILASHRTSTLPYMDQILKLKNGKIDEKPNSAFALHTYSLVH